MSAGLDQVHPRRRAMRVMVMMAVVKMRRHCVCRIGRESRGVNNICFYGQTVFSMRSITNLDSKICSLGLMRRGGRHLDELLALGVGLFRGFADFQRDVALTEADPNLLQERSGRRSSSKDPDEVIGDLCLLT